jgi:hypothetical protein
LKKIGTDTRLTFHDVHGRYVKVVPVETKKAYRESRGVAPHKGLCLSFVRHNNNENINLDK